jgi:hypothetical protein
MPRFRAARVSSTAGTLSDAITLDVVRTLVSDTLHPGHFFTGSRTHLDFTHAPVEATYWEILYGRLLDPPFTTQRKTFETWHVWVTDEGGRSAEPIISVSLDEQARQVHLTRALQCYAWEGYHAGDNVYLSRETCKWQRERVGVIEISQFQSLDDLRDELICLLFQAVVGTSRLPLTSLEAPLPAFSLGELAYFHRPRLSPSELGPGPMRGFHDLVERGFHSDLAPVERAKLLETVLRATPMAEMGTAADLLLARLHGFGHDDAEIISVFRDLFNEVALSPYTDLVEKALGLLAEMESEERVGPPAVVDLLCHIVRQLGRHLTAYDLVVFHHRGANYPDALLVDTALKALLRRIEHSPVLFLDESRDDEAARNRKRMRRRGLRQGWLLRSHYEGHAVPDAPTSEGENARVLPAPFIRVPEEQIVRVQRRTKRLFDGDALSGHLTPAVRDALGQSIADLHSPRELQELGMAIFLDRPLGVGKDPLEPDQTLLFSYEAFSRSVAKRRLDEMTTQHGLLDEAGRTRLQSALCDLAVTGVPVDSLHPPSRSGLVSLLDARKVADDFLLLRNTRRTAEALLDFPELRAVARERGLDFLLSGERFLLTQGYGEKSSCDLLTLFDADLRPRARFAVDCRSGYMVRGGVEYPAGGLRFVG